MVRYFKIFILVLLVYAVIIAALGITYDTFYTMKYGGIDLRNRVVGTRNLLAGNDPYYTKWDAETPEYLVDGRDYQMLSVSRCTATPSFLLMHVPFAKIPYKTQQYIWFTIQELMLILSLLILARAAKEKYKIILIIGFIFFLGSTFWRMHIANGQVYILFVFAISLAYFILKSSLKNKEFWTGFILGISTCWRPPLMLAGIPFLVNQKWKVISGGILGILFGFLSTFFVAGITTWKNYFSAMKIHGLFHSGFLQPKLSIHPNSNNIESIRNSFFSADVPGTDSSIQGLANKFFGYSLNSTYLWLGLIVVIVLLSLNLWKNSKKSVSIEVLFYQGTVLVLISEYFLPAARLSYNNVIWLIPLSMLIIMVKDWRKLLNFPLIFLLVGFAANYLYNIFPHSILFAEYCLLIYFVWMWFVIPKLETNTAV
jgi:Glycosyltransferase family 87